MYDCKPDKKLKTGGISCYYWCKIVLKFKENASILDCWLIGDGLENNCRVGLKQQPLTHSYILTQNIINYITVYIFNIILIKEM
jgi:hypothetical protein